jgi:glutamate mutase epsilon subunit
MEQLQENIENIEEFSRTNKEDFLHYIVDKYERLKI